MSYLDALKKAAKTTEVPYPNKAGTSEFIETDIGQGLDDKKMAKLQKRWDRLSPKRKKELEARFEKMYEEQQGKNTQADKSMSEAKETERLRTMHEYKMRVKEEKKASEAKNRDAKQLLKQQQLELKKRQLEAKQEQKEISDKEKITLDPGAWVLENRQSELDNRELERTVNNLQETITDLREDDKTVPKMLQNDLSDAREQLLINRQKMIIQLENLIDDAIKKYGGLNEAVEYLIKNGIPAEVINQAMQQKQ